MINHKTIRAKVYQIIYVDTCSVCLDKSKLYR